MVQASILEDRAVIGIGGVEARDFLQGLITNDMNAAQDGHALYAALLTPQGKILFDFFVVPDGERFLLEFAAARASELVKRLTLYRLRAKVEIAARPDLSVAAFWSERPVTIAAQGLVLFPDPRLDALGVRAIGTREALTAAMKGAQADAGDYRAHRLSLGVPDSADLPPDTVFALDAGMEELNGVNFKKGCYVGQEVTSRMKHRASARRRFVIAEVEGESVAPPPGTFLEAQGRALGEMATGNGRRALALVRLDRLAEAEAAGAAIVVAGKAVRLRKPEWVNV